MDYSRKYALEFDKTQNYQSMQNVSNLSTAKNIISSLVFTRMTPTLFICIYCNYNVFNYWIYIFIVFTRLGYFPKHIPFTVFHITYPILYNFIDPVKQKLIQGIMIDFFCVHDFSNEGDNLII